MKKQILSSLILAGTLVVATAQAEENQNANTSTVKVTDVQKKDEQNKGDLDQEITNAKMRAESGSKSKLSIAMDLTYNGGNLEDPFGPIRPNYAGVSGADSNTSLSADIAVAYRLSARDSLRFGAGANIDTPLQNNTSETTNQDGYRKASVSTPYVSWGRSFRAMDLQQSVSVGGYYYTTPYMTEVYKANSSLSASWTVLGEIPNTNWQPGLSLSLSYVFFDDGANAGDTASSGGAGRSDCSIGLFPFIEYAFNDMFSFRTVFRPSSFDHYRNDDATTFDHNMWTQSVGLGIAMTRDVYLYPNFQFAPEYAQADTTNVGISATINMF
ncbi:hypothetical protein [Bdellovibrio sp. HCB288]|uniref:hypothetical protein n=1 Tax=Bdellovibrio sp. HCB288 TaxID=3394355 RepID=UPI0039B5CE2A